MVRVAVLSVDTSNATEEEKSELDAIIERYDELLEKIEELLQPTPEPNSETDDAYYPVAWIMLLFAGVLAFGIYERKCHVKE